MILLPQTPPLVKLAPSIVLLPTQGAPEPKDPLRVFQSIGGIDAGALEACKKVRFNVSKQKDVSATMKTLGLATPEKGGRWPVGTLLAVGKSLGVTYVGCWTDANAFAQRVETGQMNVVGKVKFPIREDGEGVVARWTLCEIASGKTLASFVEKKAEYTNSLLKSSNEVPAATAGRRFAATWTESQLKSVGKVRGAR